MRLQQIDRDTRLKEMILHIARRCRTDARFDVPRLCSVLFCIDFWAYSDAGASMTGAEYSLYQGKPAPRGVRRVLREMCGAGDLDLDGVPTALREPDLSVFTDAQIAFVDGTIRRLQASA